MMTRIGKGEGKGSKAKSGIEVREKRKMEVLVKEETKEEKTGKFDKDTDQEKLHR